MIALTFGLLSWSVVTDLICPSSSTFRCICIFSGNLLSDEENATDIKFRRRSGSLMGDGSTVASMG